MVLTTRILKCILKKKKRKLQLAAAMWVSGKEKKKAGDTNVTCKTFTIVWKVLSKKKT